MAKLAILCVVIFFLLVCPIRAALLGTIDIANTGYGAYDFIQVWGGGQSGNLGVGGVFMLEKSGGSGEGNLWANGPLGGFCMELSEEPSGMVSTYDVVMPEEAHKPTTFLGGPIGTAKAEYLRELWAEHFDSAWVGSGPFSTEQKNNAKAFAAALWEIIYEDLPSSPPMWDVTVDGTADPLGLRCEPVDAAMTTANDWLHGLDGIGEKANLRALVYEGKQDFLVEVPGAATIFILGFGVLALRVKKNKSS